jgi:DNA-binding protein HU-beta
LNNKEFISRLATKMDISPKEAQKLATTFINELAENLDDGNSLKIQGFGSFEVKKKLERVVVNPTTKQRMLVPPKLALSFKPSNLLKDKFK